MNITKNTILITGGTSGIGLELAKQLIEHQNTVIITGRDDARLQAAKALLPALHTYKSDVSDTSSIEKLYEKIAKDFPSLNILINNAGLMRMLDVTGDKSVTDIAQEINVNLLGPIRMIERFLPLLKKQKSSAIVNLSSGLAFLPLANAPIYSATKAGIHAYTQSLRLQLTDSHIKVFELAPPPTDTALLDNFGSASLSRTARGTMKTDKMVQVAIKGIENDRYEIRPGISNVLKIASRIAPKFTISQVSKSGLQELKNKK